MKNILLILLVILTSCGGKNKQANAPTSREDTDVQTIPMYVVSPAGLIIRDSASLEASPIRLAQYGSEVLVDIDRSAPSVRAGKTIGQILPLSYDGENGYAYTGYLSVYPSPDPDEPIKDYVGRIAPFFPELELEEEDGQIALLLPEATMPAAFYYTKRLYGISDRFPLPDPTGQPTDSLKFENPENPARFTTMKFTRKGDRVNTIAFEIHRDDSLQLISLSRKRPASEQGITITSTLKGI